MQAESNEPLKLLFLCATFLAFGLLGCETHSSAHGLRARLLPHCQPLLPPSDPYGDPAVELILQPQKALTINDREIALGSLDRRLKEIFQTRTSRLLFVSFGHGYYGDLVDLLDRLQPLHFHLVLLTPKSGRELRRAMAPWQQLLASV